MFTTANIRALNFEGLETRHPSGFIDVLLADGKDHAHKDVITIQHSCIKTIVRSRRFKVLDRHPMGDGIRMRFHVKMI